MGKAKKSSNNNKNSGKRGPKQKKVRRHSIRPFAELIRRLHKVKGHNHLDDLKEEGGMVSFSHR